MALTKAAILSTGDELTSGRTLDTNAGFIAERLVATGFDVVAVLVVGDYRERIAWAWNQALAQADVIISTGGLGPTADDLTNETLAEIADKPLVLDEEQAQRIRQMFAAMGRTMPENNLKQALLPEGSIVIPNALGTAPGFRLDIVRDGRVGRCFALPGVPREMKPMLEERILPLLQELRGTRDVYRSHTFQTFGISESALDELVAGAVDPALGRIAFRAAFPQISVRVTVHGPPEGVDARLSEAAERMRERVGPYCYGEGDVTMEAAVGELLTRNGATIALAESCTGGLIGHRLTDVPGASSYVLAGVVAYGNRAKMDVLGVQRSTLDRYGAVSNEVAVEMANGARRIGNATLGLATTGIAGPTGGTAEKPVGTVHIALCSAQRTFAHRYQLWGNRQWVKLLTSQIALDWVRRVLVGEDPTASAILRR
jgi:competence/damage-inducible protein CinA-like protein